MTHFADGLHDRWHDLSDWFRYDVPRRSKRLGLMVVLVLLCGATFWLLRPGDSSEDGNPSETSGATTETIVSNSQETTPREFTSDADSVAAEGPTPVSALPATSESTLGYPTGPGGLPLPVVVLFDTETTTISGQVPSEAAKDRLTELAVASSRFPDAQVIDDMVINPAVPISVGVRVIDLDSVRFPEGSAEILPEHALELDRVVDIMRAFPNISVVVVGHADQRGDDVGNFAISDERARAVVNYLRYLGISPTRSSSRAAGESDLRAAAEDPLSSAINRRTEFVYDGLLMQ